MELPTGRAAHILGLADALLGLTGATVSLADAAVAGETATPEGLAAAFSSGLESLEAEGGGASSSAAAASDSVKLSGTKEQIAKAQELIQSELSTPGAINAQASQPATGSGGPNYGRGGINIAGRRFRNRDEVVKHVKSIQEKVNDGPLNAEDSFFFLHLALNHPRFTEKVSVPISGFRYGDCPGFQGTKAFVAIHSDGSEQGVSWQKSLDVLCPRTTAAAVAAQTSDGGKRPREDGEEEPKLVEKVAGTVLQLKGLPDGVDYVSLRGSLEAFGKVCYLELKSAERFHHGEAENEEAAAPEAGTEGEAKTGDGEAKAADGEEGQDFIPLKSKPAVSVWALCRYEEPQAATKAASEFKAFDGTSLESFVLEGEAEDRYWQRYWRAQRRKYQKGEGKGGDKGWGKGSKGKGKGKGKEGKGKGKGKGRDKSSE